MPIEGQPLSTINAHVGLARRRPLNTRRVCHHMLLLSRRVAGSCYASTMRGLRRPMKGIA